MAQNHKEPVIKPAAMTSDINVTPFCDVCLVLLIIFMVITPLLQKGVDVALPDTKEPVKIPETEKQLVVAIKMDGSVFVGADYVPKNQVAGRFKQIRTDTPQKEIVVKGDKRLKYKDVRQVMKDLNDAGFTNVGLIVMKRDTSAGHH